MKNLLIFWKRGLISRKATIIQAREIVYDAVAKNQIDDDKAFMLMDRISEWAKGNISAEELEMSFN